MRMNDVLAAVCLTLLAAGPARAQESAVDDDAPAAVSPKASEDGASRNAPRRFETTHAIEADGETIDYRVIAGETYLKNKDGEPVASIFSTTYLAESPRASFFDRARRQEAEERPTRPVAFIFNGGPGSASLWLHMGVFGPKRVALAEDPDTGLPLDDGAAPYDLVDNPYTILSDADLVFIDPVGTGFSKTMGEGKNKDYWGVKEDAASLRQFIRLWLSEHKRWNAPKYLLGESYGTTRIAALLEALESGWTDVSINGVVLVSTVLNFGLDATDPGNDVGYIGLMPGYAATAWYHGQVEKDAWDGDFDAFLDDARAFALDDYLPALVKGQLLSQEERAEIGARLSEFIGLDADYLKRANLRAPLRRFMRELLREDRQTVGRLDSRFVGPEPDGVGENPEYDPSAYGIDGAYTSAMLDYFTRDLEVDVMDDYSTLGGVSDWNWDAQDGGGDNAYVNVAPWLERAMRQNSDLRVLAANGYYDLATPFFATELTFAQPGFDRERIELTYYEAGHMMYIHEPALEALAADVRRFLRAD